MVKTLAIRVGSAISCRLPILSALELRVHEHDVVTLDCVLSGRFMTRVQVKMGDGPRWLPETLESRLYRWEELSTTPTESGVQLCCAESPLKKELCAKEVEVQELTDSAIEMQQAAAALMKRYEEVVRARNSLKTEAEALQKELRQAQAQAARLESALSARTLERDRLTLQCTSLRAKSAAYEATLQALRLSPAVDEIDELLRDRLRVLEAPAFVRICEGQYFCEGQQIAVTVKAGSLAVKCGEGFQPLEDWLRGRKHSLEASVLPRSPSTPRSGSCVSARSRSVHLQDSDEKTKRRVRGSNLNSPR